MVDGRVNTGEKVAKFLSFVEKIRNAHFKRKEADAMKVTPSKPRDSPAGTKPKSTANKTGAHDPDGKGKNSHPTQPKTGGSKTKEIKCLLCSQQHRIFACKEIDEATDNTKLLKLHQKMQEKRVCTRCMQKKIDTDIDHVKKCSNSFTTKDGKELSFDCKEGCTPHSPNKGINKKICFCHIKQPESKSNRVNVAAVHVLRTNGCSIGGAVMAMEEVQILKKGGEWENVILQYDEGAQNSCIASSLAKRAERTSIKGNFTVGTLSGTAANDNQIHSLTLKAKGSEIKIEGLGIRNDAQSYEQRTIPLPKKWQKQYRMTKYKTPEGRLEILLGQDALRYHPQIVDETPGGDV